MRSLTVYKLGNEKIPNKVFSAKDNTMRSWNARVASPLTRQAVAFILQRVVRTQVRRHVQRRIANCGQRGA